MKLLESKWFYRFGAMQKKGRDKLGGKRIREKVKDQLGEKRFPKSQRNINEGGSEKKIQS